MQPPLMIKPLHRPIRSLVAAALLGGALTAAGAVSATGFDHGLPESDILDSADVDTQATLGLNRFRSGQGTSLDLTPRVRIGLPGALDTAISAPMRADLETDDNALRHLRGEIGYRLPTPQGVEGSLRAYATVIPEPAQRGVGSGNTAGGISGQWAGDDWLEGPRVHLRAALERLDLRVPEASTGDRARYELGNLVTLDGVLEFSATDGVTPYLGLQVSRSIGSNSSREHQTIAARPAVALELTREWHLEAVGHFDLVGRDARPSRAAFLTLNYQHRPSRPDWDALARQLATTQVQVDELGRRVSDIERRLRDDPRPEPEPTGVQIINHSGIPDLEADIASLLEEEGFEIGRVGAEEDVGRRDRTVVEYAPGHAAEARAIARTLPGFQMIEPNDDLPSGVEIRVLLGFDLE